LLGVDGTRNSVAITATAADSPPMLTSMAGLRPGCGWALTGPGGRYTACGRSG
jgi:hypothetical protein